MDKCHEGAASLQWPLPAAFAAGSRVLRPAQSRDTAQQAAIARRHGIQGFCIYNYWFSGKRLLETPLETLLAHPDIDMPFCLCWANENWTRRWDGMDDEILIAQHHSPEDDIALARNFETALRDARYIHIGDRPLLIVYRPGLLPNSLATARRWRTHFIRAGLGDPYLVMVQAFGELDPREMDSTLRSNFPPTRSSAMHRRLITGCSCLTRNLQV